MPLVDLDRFDFLYSERVKGMKTAATRDLMATLSRPGIISLAGGFPDTRAFGEEAFREISGSIARDTAQALQYGPTSGLEPVKDVIVEVMAAEGHAGQAGGRLRHHRRPAGPRPHRQGLPRRGRRDPLRGPDLRGRPERLRRLQAAHSPRPDGQGRHDTGGGPRDAEQGPQAGPARQVHLHRPQLPEPGRASPW